MNNFLRGGGGKTLGPAKNSIWKIPYLGGAQKFQKPFTIFMFKKVYFFVMEVKVWFEGKTLKKPSKFDWKWSLHCQKIDKKKSVEWGRPPPRPVMENSILFIFFIFETFPKMSEMKQKKKYNHTKGKVSSCLFHFTRYQLSCISIFDNMYISFKVCI